MLNAEFSKTLRSQLALCLLGPKRSAPKLKAFSAQIQQPLQFLPVATILMPQLNHDQRRSCILFTTNPTFAALIISVYYRLLLLFSLRKKKKSFFIFCLLFPSDWLFLKKKMVQTEEGWVLKDSKEVNFVNWVHVMWIVFVLFSYSADIWLINNSDDVCVFDFLFTISFW